MKNAFFLKLFFDNKTRRRTWRKLASLFKTQVGERQALLMLRDRYIARKHPLGKLFTEVLAETEKGHTLDEAFSPWIPPEETMLIRGGIQSGRLPEALKDGAELIEARTKIIQALVGAVAYPCFLLFILFTIVLVLAFHVMPEMALVSNPAGWDGAAGYLYKFSSFVASPLGLGSFLLLMAFLALVMATLPLWTGQSRLYVENIPPWSIYRLVVGSVWLFTLAILLRGGIQLDFILRDMLKSGFLRPWLAERVRAIKDRYRMEGNFGTLLLSLNMKFPDEELIEELAVFAALPSFHRDLYSIAKEWLEEGTSRIKKQTQILNVVLMCVIGGLVSCLWLAYGSIQKQFTSGLGGF